MAGSSNGSSSSSSSRSEDEKQEEAAAGSQAEPLAAESQAQPSAPRPEFLDEVEDARARQQVYLVTLSGLLSERAERVDDAVADLQEPGDFNHEQIRDAFLWAVANPVCGVRGGRPRKNMLAIEKIAVFREAHADGRIHYHVALKLNCQTCCLPLKLALMRQYRLASHWSSTHTLLWSAIRYGFFTSPRKQVVDKAPKGWLGSGEVLNLYKESQEPWNADVIVAASCVPWHQSRRPNKKKLWL